MDDGILRQRRNLMVMHVVLTLYYSAGIQLSTKVTYLGAEFSVDRPEFLLYAGWFAWAYFGLRYWQYVRASQAYLDSTHDSRGRVLMCCHIRHHGTRAYTKQTDSSLLPSVEPPSPPKGYKTEVYKFKSSGGSKETHIVYPNKWYFFCWQSLAWLVIFAKHKGASDYLYPFVAVLAPILAWIIYS